MLAAVTVIATACGLTDDNESFDEQVNEELDDAVDTFVRLQADAGGAVARVDSPRGRRTMASGPAGLDGETELAGDEAFRAASITKMLTATAALQLAEEGAVDLDAPVADVLPDRAALFEHGDEVTLRQLLGHTAGLPDPSAVGPAGDEEYIADLLAAAEVEDRTVTVPCEESRDRLAYAADRGGGFEPGTDWEYSNTGYFMAGEIIEAVTEQPLEQVYRERILDPLGMDDSWLACAEEPRAELASGLHPPGAAGVWLPGQDDEPFDVTGVANQGWAAGGLVSTVDDLTVFARALFQGELFEDTATLDEMLEPGPEPIYGLGVEHYPEAVGHRGSVAGYHSRLLYQPDEELVIVALSNESFTPPGSGVATPVLQEVRDIATGAD